MADETLRRVERVVTTYDITWLLDLAKNSQLDLDPSYQRKSVWTPKDRRFFMDTIFRNYPSPAIFLHKTIDDMTGNTTYHVVDGKQRITTILQFVQNKFALGSEFGDLRLDGMRWRDLTDPSLKRLLWNYRITIEELDDASILDINDVFSRLNKNASKLTRQELRHARFDGWLIHFLEEEAQDPIWKEFKIRTTAKERRMSDVQNLSELAAVILRNKISGFSQDDLDQLYVEHDLGEAEAAEADEFDPDIFKSDFMATRNAFQMLERDSNLISTWAQPFLHFYTLWAALHRNLDGQADLAHVSRRYQRFMSAVKEYEVSDSEALGDRLGELPAFERNVAIYKSASVGATTEEPKRRDRQTALESALFLGVE